MVVMERRPEFSVRSTGEAELRVDRTEIWFQDVNGDKVRIDITVGNEGEHRSRPTLMRIESAPFGAFVPWRPLTQMVVPALEPGESRELSTEVARPRPAPLGGFDRLPPKRLLSAVSAPDQPAPGNNPFAGLLGLMRGQPGRPSALAPDLWDWVGRGQPHWAGNLNVFVGRRPVERHLAKALRIYPGRTNLAMFLVGSFGKQDAFSFELAGLAPQWKAALYDMTNCKSLVDTSDAPIPHEQWVESSGGLMVVLATQPPVDCTVGNLEVHVRRRGCQEPAIVEFNLDPGAQGTGCYFV